MLSTFCDHILAAFYKEASLPRMGAVSSSNCEILASASITQSQRFYRSCQSWLISTLISSILPVKEVVEDCMAFRSGSDSCFKVSSGSDSDRGVTGSMMDVRPTEVF